MGSAIKCSDEASSYMHIIQVEEFIMYLLATTGEREEGKMEQMQNLTLFLVFKKGLFKHGSISRSHFRNTNY